MRFPAAKLPRMKTIRILSVESPIATRAIFSGYPYVPFYYANMAVLEVRRSGGML